jgi:hypothetical protein
MSRLELVRLVAERPQARVSVRHSACSSTILPAEVVLAWVASETISVDAVTVYVERRVRAS